MHDDLIMAHKSSTWNSCEHVIKMLMGSEFFLKDSAINDYYDTKQPFPRPPVVKVSVANSLHQERPGNQAHDFILSCSRLPSRRHLYNMPAVFMGLISGIITRKQNRLIY